MEKLIVYGVIVFVSALAIFAFRESGKQKHGFRFRNKPDFTPLKLNEDKINDHSKN